MKFVRLKFLWVYYAVILNLINFFVNSIHLTRRATEDNMTIRFEKNFYRYLLKENMLREYKEKVKKIQNERVKFVSDFGWRSDIRPSNFESLEKAKISRSLHPGNKILPKRTNYTFFDHHPYDYAAISRHTKFYFSLSNECNGLVNDTIVYKESNSTDVDYVEHLLLNNNIDSLQPKGVFSDDVDINLYIYNKKFHLFTVFLDKANKTEKIYPMEYVYSANNIIKSKHGEIKTNKSDKAKSEYYNFFTWKFYNDNIAKTKQKVVIEFYFSVDKLFENENVFFKHNSKPVEYSKRIVTENNKRRVVYKWTGELKANEIIIVDGVFPHYFENCGNFSIDIQMIVLGSFFILLLIIIFYIVLSQIFKLEEF